MLVSIALIIFWRWMSSQNIAASEAACKNKQISYCTALLNKEDVKWEEINPKTGCESLGFTRPSEQDCKTLLR